MLVHLYRLSSILFVHALVMTLYLRKMADSIEMLFGVENDVLDTHPHGNGQVLWESGVL